MAIEFHCPYCTTTVRVTNDAAGKQGSCPQCGTAIIVPQPAMSSLPPSTATTPATITLESPADLLAIPPSELAVQEPDATTEVVMPATSAGQPIPLVIPTETGASAIGLRSRRQRLPWVLRQYSVPALILMGLGIVLFGILGFLVLQDLDGLPRWTAWNSSQLTGTLAGSEIDDPLFEPTLVPKSLFKLPEERRQSLLKQLAFAPIPLTSQWMHVQFRGTPAGMTVAINRGAQARWYRVDPDSSPSLQKYAAREGTSWDRRRRDDLVAAADGFLQTYQKIQSHEADPSEIVPYRNTLGLAATVRGTGYVTVAVVGRNTYPCVWEDTDGALYFLLPKQVTQFTLQGRKLPNGATPFRGTLTVRVSPSDLSGE